ncbi:cell wall-binding protein, partial [Bacillus mycoides]|uniref:N-acetylmuramoyl-L-alanine amidase family protein n=1 Tax=Bacillus mycoides TaxID=1405 RepID=UPI002E1FEF3A|nr:cell wall-binding protein [Bacillus mycoides]
KVKADVDTFGTIVTTLGSIYDAFGKEAFTKYLEEVNAKSSYNNFWENITYIAPTFKKGEFGITVFDYYKNQDFSQKVKIAYPNGKVEYKTLKHGQQLRIKDAGTIVDLTPDEPELSKHDLLYITQKQLDEGKTGVSLTNFKTYYLESDNSGRRNELGWDFIKKQFPNAYHPQSGLPNIGVNEDELFKKLPEDKQMLGTSTSKTVGKEALSNYVTNDSEALADFNNRVVNVFADANLIFEANLVLGYLSFDGDTIYQIIPYKKGSNKVVIKKGSKYLSGKEGQSVQFSDSIGDDEVLELVQIENSGNNEFQFNLINKNGARLTNTPDHHRKFTTTDKDLASNIRFPAKNNNEIHNWLINWYPGKENERPKYDEVEFKFEGSSGTAKDASGNVIKNSWVKRDIDYYYAGSDGVFLTGWQEIDGKTYYFEPYYKGKVMSKSGSNGVHVIDGKWYHFDDKGALQRSAWVEDAHGLAYSDASGAFIENGLREIDGKIYYFKDCQATKNEIRLEDQNVILHFSDKGALEKVSKLNGEALSPVNEVTFEEKTLMFEGDGSTRKSGISKIFLPGLNLEGKEQPALVYYSLEEGRYYTGWKEVDGKKYYFQDGINYTFDGYDTIDGKRYYFNHDGEAKLTGFDKVDGKIYYYNDKGEMQKNDWKKIDGKYYYFDASGAAKIGWFNGPYETSNHGYGYFRYYAKADGSIYLGVTVEINGKNYTFDSDGHKH